MPAGAGKYDDLCTYVREKANAQGAIVIVFGGDKGSSFAVQMAAGRTPTVVQQYIMHAELLESIASEFRKMAAGESS